MAALPRQERGTDQSGQEIALKVGQREDGIDEKVEKDPVCCRP